MTNETYEVEELSREIARLRNDHPHLETILKALDPLLLEKNQWLADTAVDKAVPSIDPLRYAEGISVCQQHQLFSKNDPWASAGWSAAKAIADGFPHFAAEMEVLVGILGEGRYDCFLLFFDQGEGIEEQLVEKAADLGISQVALRLFLQVVNRFMLTKKARDLKGELKGLSWKKGYCPVCGGFPHLAILGDQGQRQLHCADCGSDWSFARLTCPYCEHEDPQNTNIFFIEGQKENSAFTCDKCSRYLLTANRSASVGSSYPDLVAVSLIHLDLILQEKGYKPMTESEWNSFALKED